MSTARRRSRWRTSGRYLLVASAAFVLLVVVLGRAVARFYIDALWFDALDQSSVYWEILRAKVTLFVMFFGTFVLLAAVNLGVADKLAPSRFPAEVHPYVARFHDAFGRRLRLYRYLVATLFGLLLALPATAQWQAWLLYRHSQDFGRADAQFGVDVGFYVFELPFVSFLVDWLFWAVVVVLLLAVVTHILNGGVIFAAPVPSVGAGMKGHVAVLLAVLAVLKAADYWIRRYEATNARRGFVQGPTYSVVHAQLPALVLLAVVALVTAGLYLSTLRTHSWRVPLVASGIWMVLAVVGGYVYPAVVQSLVVRPNQKAREAPYIEHNVEATRQAMGLTDEQVAVVPIGFGPLSGAAIADDPRPLGTVRLLNPTESRSRFQQSQGQAAGLTIADLDIDRYPTGPDGQMEQVLVAAKELSVTGAPNQTWQGRHLISTHGCGLVMAPASRVDESGEPLFTNPPLERPELYFSPSLSGWAVAGSEADEQGCGGRAVVAYSGTSGVPMSSWWRRAAFALALMDYNLIGSRAIGPQSRMLWTRNIRDRVAKLAPFLTFDGDPYPVVVDGRVLWVIDTYTSTSRYPYAEAVGSDVVLSEGSGIPRDANYIRNSVKAVVDAYDGSVRLYVVDEVDPIVRAWQAAFPGLFTPSSAMPAELRAHLRYPEDLFRVQTTVYSKYQLDPGDFFDRRGAWSVAQATGTAPRDVTSIAAVTPAAAEEAPTDFATESSNNRFTPYYTLFAGLGAGAEEFVLIRPFVPFSRDDQRTELQAFMTATSDGRLTVYVVGDDPLPAGPRSVASSMESDPDVSEQVTFLNQARGGTNVRFGDLQLVPIAGGILWMRPFYVSAQLDNASVTDYEFMIVAYSGRVAISTTIGGALAQLFPGLELDVGERVVAGPPPGSPALDGEPPVLAPGTGSLPPGAGSDDVLVRVHELLVEADAALAAGDLGLYQQKVDEASDLLAEHLDGAVSAPPATTEPG